MSINPHRFSSLSELVNHVVMTEGSISKAKKTLNLEYYAIKKIVEGDTDNMKKQSLRKLEHSLKLKPGRLDSFLEKSIDINQINDSNSIGEALRYCRESKNMYQREVAEKISVNQHLVWCYESGYIKASYSYVKKAAKMFKVPVSAFDKFFQPAPIPDIDYKKAGSINHFGNLLSYIMQTRNMSKGKLQKALRISNPYLSKQLKSKHPDRHWRRKVSPGKLKKIFNLKKDVFSPLYKVTPEYKQFESFGETLFHYRKQFDLTREELSSRLGVSYEAIRLYEINRCFPEILSSRDFQSALNLESNVFAEYFKKK